MPVFPDRRMFHIHDPEVTPDAPGSPLPPVGALISTSREQLWVGSLQQDIDVRLVLEEWDGQPLLPDAWRMYADLFNQHRDPLSDDFQREKRKLEGVERYLVQLWRDSLSPGLDASKGFPRPGLQVHGASSARGFKCTGLQVHGASSAQPSWVSFSVLALATARASCCRSLRVRGPYGAA